MKSPEKWIAALIVAVLGLAGFGIFMTLRSPASKESTASSSTAAPTLDQSATSVSAVGRLEPGGEVFCVAAPSSSNSSSNVIRKWMVREGDRVKKNQVMAVLDSYDRLYTNALQAQARAKQAQIKLAQVQVGAKVADISTQPVQLEAKQAEVNSRVAAQQNAAAQYRRFEQLAKDGAISAADLGQRRLALDTANAAAQQAVKELEQAQRAQAALAQMRPVDMQQAQAEFQVAIANLQRAKAELETSATRAPIDGQVLKINVKEGEQLGSSQPTSPNGRSCNGVAEVGKTDQMYAVAEVDEAFIAKVKSGQRAKITSMSSAFPGDLTGTVESVGWQIHQNEASRSGSAGNTDARVVEVKVRLDDSRPVAKLTNSQVNVRIISE